MSDLLLEQTESARHEFFERERERLAELATGQNPEVLFIACADSRVTPESLFGLRPGQWFMWRNVGNIVPPYWQTEIGAASVLEFALDHLQVEHVVVCGHTDCGAMYGLERGVSLADNPGLARWLDLARSALGAVGSLPPSTRPAARHRALVEANVELQLQHLAGYPLVRAAMDRGALTLHGWVYYLAEQAIGRYDSEDRVFYIERS